MTWFDAYWAALVSLIESTWPEVRPGDVAMDTTSERKDWINLLNQNQLRLPFVVVKVSAEASDDGPPDYPGYNVTSEISYIADTALPPGAPQKTAATYLVARLTALSSAAMLSSELGTVWTQPGISFNADNPMNVSLLDAQIKFQAGSVTIISLVVDTGFAAEVSAAEASATEVSTAAPSTP